MYLLEQRMCPQYAYFLADSRVSDIHGEIKISFHEKYIFARLKISNDICKAFGYEKHFNIRMV